MPRFAIPSRVVEIGLLDGRSIEVARWDGEPDLVAMLLLPARPELTDGYERYGGALAESGVSVLLPTATLEPGPGALATIEHLLGALRSERSRPPVVLAGHGIGGRVALDYLASQRPRPDLAVLIGPDLPAERRPSLVERLLGRSPPSEVKEALGPFDVRTHLQAGGMHPAAAAFLRSQRPGDASIYPALGQDLPNEPGWRERAAALAGWIERATREQWPDALPPALARDRWERMTRAEATAAHEAYVAGEPDRLARFRDLVARRGGPELTATREGMARLGAWLLEAMEVGPWDADRPDWARDAVSGLVRRLSSESLWLIDGAASHVAASLRSLEPTLRWELCTERIDAYYHRTVLEPIHLAPPVPATAITRELTKDEPNGDWLAGTWDAWMQAVRAVRDNPQALDPDPLPLDEVAVDPYDGDPWNAQIWIPEGAEAVLGSERFGRLGERMRRLKGIEDLAWEDREVMLIRLAPGVAVDDVRRRVVALLRRERKGAETDEASVTTEPDTGP